jgi:parallel beta-helix repeat protein
MKKGLGGLSLIIISILLVSFVSAGVFSDTWNKITGKIIGSPSNAATCTETDNGDKPYIPGIVFYSKYPSTKNYTDVCTSKNKKVTEYSCDNKREPLVITKIYDCPNGCLNGACLTKKEISKCGIINESGNYYLSKNLLPSNERACISIVNSNVNFDLNGKSITKPANSSTWYGVLVEDFNLRNITIKNGAILGKFESAISYNGNKGAISNMTIASSYLIGLTLYGNSNLISGNKFKDSVIQISVNGENNTLTKNSLELYNLTQSSELPIGIEIYSANGRNMFSENNLLTRTDSGYSGSKAIVLTSSPNNIILKNNISGLFSYGIYSGYSSNNQILNNTLNGNNYITIMGGTGNNLFSNKASRIYFGNSNGNNVMGNNLCSNVIYNVHCLNANNNTGRYNLFKTTNCAWAYNQAINCTA